VFFNSSPLKQAGILLIMGSHNRKKSGQRAIIKGGLMLNSGSCKKYSALFLLFLTFALASFCTATAETLTFTFSDFPPFEYTEKDLFVGINTEIIKEACKRLHIKPVFIELPWKRALKNTKRGKADAVFSLFKNAERVKHYSFPEENLNTVRMVLVTNRESGVKINTLGDLRGKRVGIFLGSSYGAAFDNDKSIIKEAAPTNESLIRMQAAGRIDITVIDERVVKFWSKKIGMEDTFKILDFIVTENPTYVAFSKAKGNKNWAAMFSGVLKEMKNDGFIEEINKKYAFKREIVSKK